MYSSTIGRKGVTALNKSYLLFLEFPLHLWKNVLPVLVSFNFLCRYECFFDVWKSVWKKYMYTEQLVNRMSKCHTGVGAVSQTLALYIINTARQ